MESTPVSDQTQKTKENEKIIDRIVSMARLNELKSAVKKIDNDEAIIIEGIFNKKKNIKRGS